MTTIRVYKYGAKPALGPQLRQQMDLGHHYYNQLVEAENARRRGIWGGPKPVGPPTHECGCASDKHRDKRPHRNCGCSICREHWKELYKQLRSRLDVKPLRKVAAEQGLYWGTYLVVEQAFAQTVADTHAREPVKFKSWRQGKVAAVQIQQPERGPRFWRLEKCPDDKRRRASGGRGRHNLQIRIGTKGRDPIWSEPVKMVRHRLHEGRVRWVRIHLHYVGESEVVSVHFVCSDVAEKPRGKGLVAVDASWRLVDDSLRLAWARDEQGREYELTLGPQWRECGARADRIRSHRANHRNTLQAQYPELARYKSSRSVRRAILRLGVPTVEQAAWMERDLHLEQYELGCRRRSRRVRRAAMQEWVCELRRTYGQVAVKDTNHKKIKERAREKKELHQPARRQGHHGAPGELIGLLRQEFGDENMRVVPAPHTTATCLKCRQVTKNVGPERIFVCEHCGAADDRDRVSTENLLREVRAGRAGNPSARKTTPRFASRHAK